MVISLFCIISLCKQKIHQMNELEKGTHTKKKTQQKRAFIFSCIHLRTWWTVLVSGQDRRMIVSNDDERDAIAVAAHICSCSIHIYILWTKVFQIYTKYLCTVYIMWGKAGLCETSRGKEKHCSIFSGQKIIILQNKILCFNLPPISYSPVYPYAFDRKDSLWGSNLKYIQDYFHIIL
jgi:hypothetical protein